MTGKKNVIAAMKSGARLFLGGYANNNRLQFGNGRIERVHGLTVPAVIDTGLIELLKIDPWSPMSQEWVLKEGS